MEGLFSLEAVDLLIAIDHNFHALFIINSKYSSSSMEELTPT
jgi:hypothetical protein